MSRFSIFADKIRSLYTTSTATTPVISPNTKVLFILKYRELYGEQVHKSYSSGLYNSASFVSNMLTTCGIQSKIVEVADNNYIHKEVNDYQPTHVIIEALWVVPSKLKLLASMYPNIKWIIRVHSNTSFIANEGIAIKWLSEYLISNNNVYISVNSIRFINDLTIILEAKHTHNTIDTDRILYLPNYYEFTSNNPPAHTIDYYNQNVNIGCFGAIRPLKNQLIQAVAAIKFANQHHKILHFHINDERLEQGGDNVLKNLQAVFSNTPHILVLHEWLERKQFLELVHNMDMCMQVSISETFNIVAADSVNENVPVIVSSEIDWIDKLYHANAMCVNDIVDRLTYAWSLPSQLNNWKHLHNYNLVSKAQWVLVLSQKV